MKNEFYLSSNQLTHSPKKSICKHSWNLQAQATFNICWCLRFTHPFLLWCPRTWYLKNYVKEIIFHTCKFHFIVGPYKFYLFIKSTLHHGEKHFWSTWHLFLINKQIYPHNSKVIVNNSKKKIGYSTWRNISIKAHESQCINVKTSYALESLIGKFSLIHHNIYLNFHYLS